MADRVDLVSGVLPPGVPDAARTLALALGLGLDLALARARAAQAPRLVARGRGRLRLRGRAPREGPRLRGGDRRTSSCCCRAPARAPAVRRAGRPGDDRAARCRSAPRSRVCVPILARRTRTTTTRSRERIEEALLLADRRARASARSGSGCGRCAVAPPESDDRERAAELVQEHGTRQPRLLRAAPRQELLLLAERPLVPRLPRDRRHGARRRRPDRRRRRAARADRASSAASRTRRAGASRSPARRTRRSRTTPALGFKSMYLGDEAVIRPAEFSLDGRAIRKVRQSVSRLEKCGYDVRVLSTADADERAARASCARSREEWRGNWPERGFTMAMDALFRYPDTVLAVAVAPDGAVGGFLQLVPSPASEGYSLASMRRRRDTPNGLMEYLITETVAWARAARRHRGVAQLRGLRRLPARRRGRDALDARAALGAPEGRPAVPARAPAQLQPQVLPALAAPLLLLRAVERPAARRPRVPARRVAAHAARPVGRVARPGGADEGSRSRGVARAARVRRRAPRRAATALHLVRVAQFNAPGLRDRRRRASPATSTSSSRRGGIRVLTGGDDPRRRRSSTSARRC